MYSGRWCYRKTGQLGLVNFKSLTERALLCIHERSTSNSNGRTGPKHTVLRLRTPTRARTHTHTPTDTRTHTVTHTAHSSTHTRTHTRTHARTYTHHSLSVSLRLSVSVFVSVSLCVCLCLCLCVSVSLCDALLYLRHQVLATADRQTN